MTGTRSAWIVLGSMVVLAAGCFAPAVPTGLPCTDSRGCPEGQFCDGTNTCVAMPGDDDGVDASHADAPPGSPDAIPIGCDGPEDCPVDQPVCDLGSGTCRTCVADAECLSDACLEIAGTCSPETATLYVTPTGGGIACSRAAPCNSIATAVGLVDGTHHVIKVGDGAYPGGSFSFDDGSVSVFVSGADRSWDGAVLSPNSMGIRVRNNAEVTFEGLTIQDAGGDGINQVGGSVVLERVKILRTDQAGVDARDGVLRITESWIEGADANGVFLTNADAEIVRTRLVGNGNGAVRATDTRLVLVSSVMAGNGSSSAGTSTVHLLRATAGSRLAFDSFADNAAILGYGGVACENGPVPISSSIFADNSLPQIDLSCITTYALLDGLGGPPPGIGNISGDAKFVDQPGRDLHILPGSSANGVADLIAIEPRDVDGEPRPQGVGPDMGADEIP